MTRGVRGATTIQENNAEEIVLRTEELVKAMVEQNNIKSDDVSHVFISVTKDVTDGFPAKALRKIDDSWKYVPVMCMTEIDVPDSLAKCIRVMMVIRTDKTQQEINHVFHNNAVKLRPDLLQKDGE
ncbi:chorismate mutase [Oceanobacillus iheyensis]|uniref:chorismate mutase n=1 Tax=Oceanobacillus iheyensis (strain DSM 14371 / CIP 107618 / JCM 11309 / KCTC 3954 / HTE831) TaxID=221109 RepID=Q8EQB8_OCEIH|nr:chorismate mutase [Oceanobacillus iheyensis]BAC13739.1 chorismate mutase [Oceanobacillus iheyensis HTE831]